MSSQIDNHRIAKNTILLYARTLVVMAVMLYTSRVVLSKLGIEDFGIYQLVLGFVSMFYIISSAFTTAVNRFITYEVGHGDAVRLRELFSAGMAIQACVSVSVVVVCESLGIWFFNNQLAIPPERLHAANWVLQCSLLTFCVNLMSVPYTACVMAHERMTAFAYISIADAVLKLLVCYLITLIAYDELAVYAVLMLCVASLTFLMYCLYCRSQFQECHIQPIRDRGLLKEMASFAGWNTLSELIGIINYYGVNLLVNIFFGVVMNAARGVANQAQGAVRKFVDNFSTAVNPQITKSYAAGDYGEMFALVCRGAKFSYFLLLFFAIPIVIEAEFILDFWLEEVPDKAALFVRLSMLTELISVWGYTGYTACMATGAIKKYSICVAIVGSFLFPATWLAYKAGCPVETLYYLYMVFCLALNITRLLVLKHLMGFSINSFVRNVLLPILYTTAISILLPLFFSALMDAGVLRLAVTIAVSMASVCLAAFGVGLSRHERGMIVGKCRQICRIHQVPHY